MVQGFHGSLEEYFAYCDRENAREKAATVAYEKENTRPCPTCKADTFQPVRNGGRDRLCSKCGTVNKGTGPHAGHSCHMVFEGRRATRINCPFDEVVA